VPESLKQSQRKRSVVQKTKYCRRQVPAWTDWTGLYALSFWVHVKLFYRIVSYPIVCNCCLHKRSNSFRWTEWCRQSRSTFVVHRQRSCAGRLRNSNSNWTERLQKAAVDAPRRRNNRNTEINQVA